jgi:S-(hydroxymethyl)glutathione dehydrogenase/alcohol dehydrogenase
LKAAVLRAIQSPLTFEDVEVDRPGPHEVLVRTAAAGLCGSDVSAITGRIVLPLPAVIGHESAGIVEAVGSDVDYVHPGDHVITCSRGFCGSCEYCLSGNATLCSQSRSGRTADQPARLSQSGTPLFQMAGMGSFAEQLLVHENTVVKIPGDFPLEQAALLGCGVATGFGAVLNTARLPAGARVAVVGCGAVGLSAIQGARVCGASQIIAVDTSRARLDVAIELGATDTVLSDGTTNALELVLELSDGGVDYSFEAVGFVETVDQAFSMLRRGGTCTVCGLVENMTLHISGSALLGERKLQGCLHGSGSFRVDLPRWVELARQGQLRLDEVVTATISLDQLNDAVEALIDKRGVRSVVVFS